MAKKNKQHQNTANKSGKLPVTYITDLKNRISLI